MSSQPDKRPKRPKRPPRPIYFAVRRLVDPATGEEVGALTPAHEVDRRLMRERRLRTGDEVRVTLTHRRNVRFHRLAHAIGALLADNVEAFIHLDSHEAIKRVQGESGICCDEFAINLGPLGEVMTRWPRSLAFDEMDESEFAAFFEGITAHIAEHYAHVMLDEVRDEYWQMVNGDSV